MADLAELLQKVADDGYDTDVARNLVLECKEEHVDEVIDTLFEHEGEYFFRYVVPWLPGKGVTKKLIQLLGRMDSEFQNHLYWITDHLLNCDISDHKEEFIEQIVRILEIGDEALTRVVMDSCNKFISEDLANILLSKIDENVRYLVAPIIYNSSIKNIKSNLKRIVKSGYSSGIRSKALEALLIRFNNEDLTEALQFLKDNDLLGFRPWNHDLSGSVFSTIMLHGSNHYLSLLDLFPKETQKQNSVMFSNLKSILNSRDNSVLSSESVPVHIFDKWTEYVIKGRWGFSETRLRGFYMGLSKGPQPSNERQFILSEILQKELQKVHFSRVPRHFPVDINRWYVAKISMGFLLGDWNYSDFRKRISSAREFIIEKPYSPWGFYGFEILNQDRWELMRKHGIAVGLCPYLIQSDLGLGLVGCHILDLNRMKDFESDTERNCCDNPSISVSRKAMNCLACGEQLANYELSWNDAKLQLQRSIVSSSENLIEGEMVVDSDGNVAFSKNEKEIVKLTKRKYQNHRAKMKQFMPYLPPPVRDHLAAMHADAEEMYGVSGDAMKRWGLD
jgi:hypothetical protein